MRARTLARPVEGAHSQASSQYSVPGTLHAAGATVTTCTDARALEEICGRRRGDERCASRGDKHDLLKSITTANVYRRTHLSYKVRNPFPDAFEALSSWVRARRKKKTIVAGTLNLASHPPLLLTHRGLEPTGWQAPAHGVDQPFSLEPGRGGDETAWGPTVW